MEGEGLLASALQRPDLTTYGPGQRVPRSGLYRVTHDAAHLAPHEVTCVIGEPFPPCRDCQHPRFVLSRAALHMSEHMIFKATRR